MKNKKEFPILTVIILSIMGTLTILGYAFSGFFFADGNIFATNTVTNTFISTIIAKVPAMVATIQIITIAWGLIWLLSFIASKTLRNHKRGVTIIKLLNSFIKYAIAIVAFFLILSSWGVNTTTLIASAGILTLVIGLGAQSLIADIIAGIFIVFESDFQVGDIVVIEGWRGTVQEVGIRTTKIIDAGGNLKIINNSEIRQIINQTKELSLAKCYISIDYAESIQHVELIIEKNLGDIKKAIPEIVEGPFYKGVDALSASSVDLFFIARCKEEDLYGVQRALNRQLKLMFDRNGINVPFPQVTVNQPVNIDHKVSEHDARIADAFASGQRTDSKELEESKQ